MDYILYVMRMLPPHDICVLGNTCTQMRGIVTEYCARVQLVNSVIVDVRKDCGWLAKYMDTHRVRSILLSKGKSWSLSDRQTLRVERILQRYAHRVDQVTMDVGKLTHKMRFLDTSRVLIHGNFESDCQDDCLYACASSGPRWTEEGRDGFPTVRVMNTTVDVYNVSLFRGLPRVEFFNCALENEQDERAPFAFDSVYLDKCYSYSDFGINSTDMFGLFETPRLVMKDMSVDSSVLEWPNLWVCEMQGVTVNVRRYGGISGDSFTNVLKSLARHPGVHRIEFTSEMSCGWFGDEGIGTYTVDGKGNVTFTG